MNILSHKELVKSAKIALIWVVISLAMAVVIGFLAIPIYNNPLLDVQESEKVFIKMAMDFFNPWLGGLILTAILAAIMSTIDSQLLASSTTLAQDFYAFIIRKNASEKELLMANRIFVAGITIVACILALNPNETIFSLGEVLGIVRPRSIDVAILSKDDVSSSDLWNAYRYVCYVIMEFFRVREISLRDYAWVRCRSYHDILCLEIFTTAEYAHITSI